ncbi:MAG: citrate/2-methylcitrate synthase, partial [Steroidobacteraceae bacterium]
MSIKYELKNLATGNAGVLNGISGTLGPNVVDISHLTRDFGVFTYDPGFMATASTESKITYIDGEAGELLYRGYPVEQLAEKSGYLEVANLLINGTLPTKAELDKFQRSIMCHTMINEHLLRFFQGFHHDAHPMAMVSAVVASMAAFYHDTTDIHDPRHREIFAHRIIAKLPTIAAAAYKHTLGQPFIYPRNDLRYCANMLNMFFAVPCEPYAIDPVVAEALDLLF